MLAQPYQALVRDPRSCIRLTIPLTTCRYITLSHFCKSEACAFARGLVSTMSPNHADGNAKQAANPEELIVLAKSALAETEQKQLAALDGGAQLPFGYGTQPGDTLDLSDKGVRVLPTELINLIRDRVER